MFAKVAIVGGAVKQTAYEAGTSVQRVISNVGVALNSGDAISVNGTRVPANYILPSTLDDTPVSIMITKAVKGGQFTIRVGMAGGRVAEGCVNPGASVLDAVKAAGFAGIPDGCSVTVDGNVATAGTTLRGTEQLILVSAQVKGAL